MSQSAITALYGDVHKHFFSEMYFALAIHFGHQIRGPSDIEFCMKWSSRKLIRRIYWIAKYRGCHMEKRVAILLAMCYVAAAWDATEIDTSLLERGNRLLARGESRLGCTGNLSWY